MYKPNQKLYRYDASDNKLVLEEYRVVSIEGGKRIWYVPADEEWNEQNARSFNVDAKHIPLQTSVEEALADVKRRNARYLDMLSNWLTQAERMKRQILEIEKQDGGK